MAWAYLLIVAGVVLDVLPYAADFFNMPEVASAITQYSGHYGSHILKGIGVVTALARLRTLMKGTP